MEKILQYNVPKGKKNRGLGLIYAYKLLAANQLTEDNIRLARILAWCVEMTQTHALMIDDVMDRSLFRRGQPSWYRYNDIGEVAVTDSILLRSVMYYMI